MRGREQKISSDNCPQEDRAELEVNAGVQTFIWIAENADTEGFADNGLLERIVSPDNLNRAYQQVVRNKGVGGMDKMEVSELKGYLLSNKTELISKVLAGKYRPQPVLRVEIPKDNGKVRRLGIPTVVDRLLQQAIHQVISPLYERQFSDNSFGFRPRRSAHDALRRVQTYADAGYVYAVDLDLEQYFDTVNRSKLIEILSRTIQDGRVISLIHKFLNAGVLVGSRVEEPEKGVPQGSPLSPLLGNILLNECDKELSARGHQFVRYADDMLILCKSHRAAERTLTSITSFIERKLYLRVNREKSSVVHLSHVQFLGYGFYKSKGAYRLRLHPNSRDKMKARIRVLTSGSNGKGDDRRKRSLRYYIIGWLNYFKLADLKSILLRVDEWYRRRLRSVIWKQWKRVKTRFKNLQRLGVLRRKAWEYANTRKGYWRTAGSWILSVSITTERLKRAGYLFFSDYYKQVAPYN
jgi:group II intron reverse transcriptase/maturase